MPLTRVDPSAPTAATLAGADLHDRASRGGQAGMLGARVVTDAYCLSLVPRRRFWSVNADNTEPRHVRELIAANLRRVRLDAAVSLADVVAAARRLGLEWTEPWLGGVEKGTKPVSAEQILALLVVLTDAVDHRVTLSDLLDGDQPVVLANTDPPPAPVAASYLRDLATGNPFRRAFGAVPTPSRSRVRPRGPPSGYVRSPGPGSARWTCVRWLAPRLAQATWRRNSPANSAYRRPV
jgi:hypothetical protein